MYLCNEDLSFKSIWNFFVYIKYIYSYYIGKWCTFYWTYILCYAYESCCNAGRWTGTPVQAGKHCLAGQTNEHYEYYDERPWVLSPAVRGMREHSKYYDRKAMVATGGTQLQGVVRKLEKPYTYTYGRYHLYITRPNVTTEMNISVKLLLVNN